jgi:peptidase E
MTKYILHGGNAQTPNSENDLFYSEILKDTPNEVKILLVHFAGTTEKSEINKERDTSQFNRIKQDKILTFEIADESKFIDQIHNADVIYFGGGTTPQLLSVLKKYTNLKEALEGKIIAGESAGANFLASYCYTKSGGGVVKGLGILPIKIIPHYSGEHKEDLEVIPDDLEIVLLGNYQFKVYNY